jgi:hypothetical protein
VLAAPGGGNTWIGEYRPLAALYLSDLAAYETIAKNAKNAVTGEMKRAAAPELRTILNGMRSKGKLMESASALVSKMEQDLTAFSEQEDRLRTEQEAADAKVLAQAQLKANFLALQFKFGEARVTLASAAVATEKGRREKDALMKREEWLSLFKAQLIKDLVTSGYPAPIQRRSGGQLPSVSRANESHVEIKTPYGSLPVPWADIAPQSIVAMARAYLNPDLPAEHLANRKWLLGISALFAGMDAEGQALLAEAVQTKPEYQQLMPILTGRGTATD